MLSRIFLAVAGMSANARTSGAGHPGGAAGDPAADAQVGQLPAVGAGGGVPDVPGAARKAFSASGPSRGRRRFPPPQPWRRPPPERGLP